ncbi:hypothetical protein HMSSN036_79050 [Paenibacillus macerans]|nr:hypothetical protein HMSSN036_79050 [Paenibacillus macerans]
MRQLQYSAEVERLEGRLDVSPVELIPWTEKLVGQFEPAARDKGIRLLFHPEGAEGVYRIDTEKLERILGNIISNSISYASEGGRIEVGLKTEKRQVLYRIRDTGPGFKPGEEKKVFARFTGPTKRAGRRKDIPAWDFTSPSGWLKATGAGSKPATRRTAER